MGLLGHLFPIHLALGEVVRPVPAHLNQEVAALPKIELPLVHVHVLVTVAERSTYIHGLDRRHLPPDDDLEPLSPCTAQVVPVCPCLDFYNRRGAALFGEFRPDRRQHKVLDRLRRRSLLRLRLCRLLRQRSTELTPLHIGRDKRRQELGPVLEDHKH